MRRRADIVGIFPSEPSILRHFGAVVFEQNDELQTCSRYMLVAAIGQIDKEETDPTLSVTTKGALSRPLAVKKFQNS